MHFLSKLSYTIKKIGEYIYDCSVHLTRGHCKKQITEKNSIVTENSQLHECQMFTHRAYGLENSAQNAHMTFRK
jgi:hypothetical protein